MYLSVNGYPEKTKIKKKRPGKAHKKRLGKAQLKNKMYNSSQVDFGQVIWTLRGSGSGLDPKKWVGLAWYVQTAVALS